MKPICMTNIIAEYQKVNYARDRMNMNTNSSRSSEYQEKYLTASQSFDSTTLPLEITLTIEQEKCRVRKLDVYAILDDIETIEGQFALPYKTNYDGLVISVDHFACELPRVYKYTAESTQYVLANKKGQWYVTTISREKTGTSAYKYRVLSMPDNVKEAILLRHMKF